MKKNKNLEYRKKAKTNKQANKQEDNLITKTRTRRRSLLMQFFPPFEKKKKMYI